MSTQTAEAEVKNAGKHVNVPGKPEGWVAAGDLQEVITLEKMLTFPRLLLLKTELLPYFQSRYWLKNLRL